MSEQTVRVQFIDGSERIVPAKDFHWHEEGARSAVAIVDGREVPIYKRSEPEWGSLWYEQGNYDEWKAKQKDVELTTIPVAWGVDENGVPIDTEDVSTDYQQRAEQLEQLVRDTLLYLKSIAPYSYSNAPRAVELQDRAAALGIIPEIEGK